LKLNLISLISQVVRQLKFLFPFLFLLCIFAGGKLKSLQFSEGEKPTIHTRSNYPMCSAIRLSQKLPLLQLLQKENNLKTLSPAHAFSFLVKGKTKNPPRTSGRYVPSGRGPYTHKHWHSSMHN